MRNVASSEISLSTIPSSSILNCISSWMSLFTLSAGLRACTNRILYGLKHTVGAYTTPSRPSFLTCPIPCSLYSQTCGDFAETPHALFRCCHQTHEADEDSCLYTKHPVSTNCQYNLLMLFLCGASFWNRARNSRYTVITDLDASKRRTQKVSSCCNAILET